MLSTTTAIGFLARTRPSASYNCSDPAVVPPGESTCRITAFAAEESASLSS